jgi:hypothetical protein
MKWVYAFLLIVLVAASGCISQEGNTIKEKETIGYSVADDIENVEVFHFHGNHQCQGCINVGKCAENAVNEYFQEEQKAGTVVFAHVNGELPENAGLVEKYGAAGSSLWIGEYLKNGTFSKEQNVNIWYKTSDMEKCKEYMKGVIEEKLNG